MFTRYMLDYYIDKLKDRRIGIVLLASPSIGSEWANRFGGLASFYSNKLGLQLRWQNDLLKDLDKHFKELVYSAKYPFLKGVEACETKFIFRPWRWFPPITRHLVVEAESAGRYFGRTRPLHGTDHFSIVKPDCLEHPAHTLLCQFFEDHFSQPKPKSTLPTTTLNAPTEKRLRNNDLERTIYLEKITEAVRSTARPNKPSFCVLYGASGSGKSTLALTYATINSAQFKAVWYDCYLEYEKPEVKADDVLIVDNITESHPILKQNWLAEIHCRTVIGITKEDSTARRLSGTIGCGDNARCLVRVGFFSWSEARQFLNCEPLTPAKWKLNSSLMRPREIRSSCRSCLTFSDRRNKEN